MKELTKIEATKILHQAFNDIFIICKLIDLNVTQKHLQEDEDFISRQIMASYKLK